ncbi:MAG: hypothetical protein ACJ786_23965 [Catenulispora sp.]
MATATRKTTRTSSSAAGSQNKDRDEHAGKAEQARDAKKAQNAKPDDRARGLEELRSTAFAAAKLPIVAGREAVRTAHGLPAYVGVGALAVAGVVEWPVAAAAGAGVAVLRRWGPGRSGND